MQGEGLLMARGPRPEGAPKAQVHPLVALLELLRVFLLLLDEKSYKYHVRLFWEF
jgi:hypothetical protein